MTDGGSRRHSEHLHPPDIGGGDTGRKSRLRRVAAAALLPWDGAAPVPGQIEGATFDVVVGGERAVVALRLRGGELACVCSCLERDCDHVRVALEALAGGESPAQASPPSYPAVPSAALAAMLPLTSVTDTEDPAALAEALDDLVTAVVRSGVATPHAPAVREAVDRLRQTAPNPLPMGLDRFLGRLRLGLAERDLHAVARLLVGATRLADAMRTPADQQAPAEHAQVQAWLGSGVGATPAVNQMSERTMLEVGREMLNGADRASIDRRYLVDLDSGEVFHEDKRPGGTGVSLGPCPRVVHVGLAAIGTASPPRRIRLLQYTSVPVVAEAHYAQLQNVLVRNFGVLTEQVRVAAEHDPGLAEPFAVVAPHAVGGSTLTLFDEAGHALPLTGSQEPAVLAFLADLCAEETPAFVAGRLVEQRGVLLLRPVSLGFPDGTGIRHVRV